MRRESMSNGVTSKNSLNHVRGISDAAEKPVQSNSKWNLAALADVTV